MNVLARWFGRGEHDGAAAALELPATGLQNPVLEPVPDAPTRRQRAFEPTRQAMLDTAGKQVLHGWLQNRHQTLLPLTVNFSVLSKDDSLLLAELMAAGTQAGSPAGDSDIGSARRFLQASGASSDTVDQFMSALASPPPLFRLFERIRQRHDLGPLAYILLVVVNDMRDPANAVFLQWAAAKLGLPTTVIRSVERRYRS